MKEFSAKPEHIQDVLLKESLSNVYNIEEAACSWALSHKIEFEQWFKIKQKNKPPEYAINVIMCNNDIYADLYTKICDLVNLEFLWKDIKELDYAIYRISLDCNNTHQLKNVLLRRQKNLAGSIAFGWHPGLAGGADAAQYTQIPLMVAGPAHDSLLGDSTYATSGTTSDLAQVYRYFLSQCEWSRVAIISDYTEYSKSFAESIVSERNLNYV